MAFLLRASGLYTFRNELQVPEGAMVKADNVVIDEDGVVESRRGFKKYGNETSETTKQLMSYKDVILRHFDNSIQFDDGSGNFSTFDGTFTEIEEGIRIKSVESNGNFYFTTNEGIKKIGAKTAAEFTTDPGYITNAGIDRALDFETSNSGTGGWLLDNHQVAYRIVWGTKDVNNNLLLGFPSTRVVHTNTSGSDVNVELDIQIPEGVTSDYFVQVYRTAIVNISTFLPDLPDVAGGEMQLVDERTYDYVVGNSNLILDESLEVFRENGTPLYTNEISGQGILQANAKPPIAKDVALFRNSVFYANTKTVHRREVNLLSTTGLVGYSFIIGNSDIIREYTFVNTSSSTTPAGGDVLVASTGSPAQNIDQTARELVKYINLDPDSPVYAYYESTEESLPGLILLENRTLEDQTTYLVVNNSAIESKFNPQLPVIASPNTTNIQTSTIFSSNKDTPNRVYFSKTSQPEAVPLLNYVDVGSSDAAILRIVPLRDNLMVLKEDGVYIITGSTAPNFGVRLLDNSSPITAPDSAAVLNNQIFCLSTQGIVTITETSVEVISRPIEDLIKASTRSGFNHYSASFGLGYENDRSYLIWLPEDMGDTVATQAFRYNTFTRTWTRWIKENTCGIVNPADDKLYLGRINRDVSPITGYIEEERKEFNRFDFSDEELELVLIEGTPSIQENTVLVGSVNDLSVGDSLVQTQYVTISYLNRLLKKLDADPGLADTDYYSTLSIQAGENLQNKLVALDAKLQADANIGTYTPVSFSNDFATMQTELNTIISQLNSAIVNTIYKDYKSSSGSTYYEALITAVDTFRTQITLTYQLPLIYGDSDPLTVYKGINVEVEWQPQHFGAPDKLKQIRDVTLLLDQNNFYSAQVAYNTDLSKSFSEVDFRGRGFGVWGLLPWGEFIWGGQGNDAPFRTLVPKQKQRCRYITCKFTHMNARERFRLLGISFEPRLVSSRAYR